MGENPHTNLVLTFDLEEYCVPEEFGDKTIPSDFQASANSLGYLSSKFPKSTYFTTVRFAKKFPGKVRALASKGNEIALHGDISLAGKEKKILEKICGRKVFGFRAHRFEATEEEIGGLWENGFKYDSSINPALVPGRYFKIGKWGRPGRIGKIIELPITASLGMPLSFVWFRLSPLAVMKALMAASGRKTATVHYFHPWEFSRVNPGKSLASRAISSSCGTAEFSRKLEMFVEWAKATRGARLATACEASSSSV